MCFFLLWKICGTNIRMTMPFIFLFFMVLLSIFLRLIVYTDKIQLAAKYEASFYNTEQERIINFINYFEERMFQKIKLKRKTQLVHGKFSSQICIIFRDAKEKQ